MNHTLTTSDKRHAAYSNTSALEQHIREGLIDGTWPVGSRLPPERELAKQFNVARNTLRKTMDRLVGEGLITRHVGRGTFVVQRPVPQGTMAESTILHRIHGASPVEIIELRLVLEPQFVKMAAIRASSEDYGRMSDCLAKSELASGVREFEYWDGMFHRAIIDGARNTLLSVLYEALNGARKQPEWEFMKRRSLTPKTLALYRKQHRALYEALRQRDPEAAAEQVRNHLLDIQSSISGGPLSHVNLVR